MQKLVEIRDGVTRHPNYRLATPLNLTLFAGETVAICGPNGGGKSLLVDMIIGAHPLLGDNIHFYFDKPSDHAESNIKLMTFRDVYGGAEPAYYQQRWNKGDEAEFPTVSELLDRAHGSKPFTADDKALLDNIGVTQNLERAVNTLSSGELRRFQLARTLLEHPALLVIDNPYIGLDVEARSILTELLEHISSRLTLLLVVSRATDIPPFTQKVIHVEKRRAAAPIALADYLQAQKRQQVTPITHKAPLPTSQDNTSEETHETPVIDFRHVNIQYDGRTILKDLSWSVCQGEHWALTGENGAGKTTLLSLVCADNPMSYACDISLFGCRRGSGESIWDIKRRIGYVSPEIYSTYKKDLPAIDIVASGLHDTLGLFRRVTEEERQKSRLWLEHFGAEHLADRSYLNLSSGEQRLILLVRAFVKSPTLLILDEPFHGLDDSVRAQATVVIDQYFADNHSRTLVMVTHYEDELPRCIDHRLRLTKNH